MTDDELQQRMMAMLKIEDTLTNIGMLAFSGEVQLLEWQKSTSRDGPKVKFMLHDDEAMEPFEIATVKKGKQAGQLYHVFAIRIDEAESAYADVATAPKPEPEREPNRLAQKMMQTGYFRNPKLWDAIEAEGIWTQRMHHDWIKEQKCAAALTFPHICEGDIVPHHCSHAGGQVQGPEGRNPRKIKDWYEVPLCSKVHQTWIHGTGPAVADRAQREMLLQKAVSITEHRMKDMFKTLMGLQSLNEVTESIVEDFELSVGLREPETTSP